MKNNALLFIQKNMLIGILFLCYSIVSGQNIPAYFQQEVNYTIQVSLNDREHTLTGDISIGYKNNAPVSLDTIYMHLWGNAYQNKNSAFSKQMIDHKNATFYFTDKKNMGGYDSLDFKVNEEAIVWRYHPKHRDIALLLLKESLLPGDSLVISTAFKLKIPGSFSRFGHDGQAYQITQWYPKPAVYDKGGWHPMPYLDMGEFYSEFGSFDVSISLPENYIVASTGVLQTASEKEFLAEQIEFTTAYLDSTPLSSNQVIPESSPRQKTIRYIAKNVHDFAWFADKRYLVKEGEQILETGARIKTQIFFLHNKKDYWVDGLTYVNRGVAFYSELVGNYPYPKAVAVQGALRAGGGMEYPMITVISAFSSPESLDHVIIHEVGHNWFYGILAFNERDYPWMDEGINSYYDKRYQSRYYPKDLSDKQLPDLVRFFTKNDYEDAYHTFAHQKALAQPSYLHSKSFSKYNYFLSVYKNPAVALHYLESYLSRERYDKIMRSFYTEWAFRHPQPADFRAHFEAETNEKLDWFFDGFMADTRVFDYAIRKVVKTETNIQLTIENKRDYAIPFQLGAMQKDSLINVRWIEGFTGDKIINIEAGDFDKFVVDPNKLYPDLNRHNNTIKTSGIAKKTEAVTLRFLGLIDNPDKTQISWLPSVGWNKSDGIMTGIMLYNTSFPTRRFRYFLHPMLAFRSRALTGMAKLSYDWFRNSRLRQIRASISSKSFHSRNTYYGPFRYLRISPKIELTFNSDLSDHKIYSLSFTNHLISSDRSNYYEIPIIVTDYSTISKIKFSRMDHRLMNPVSWTLEMEHQIYKSAFATKEQYIKLSGELETSFLYRLNKKIDLRLYGGVFLWHTRRMSTISMPGTLGLVGYAQNDYTYEDFFFDRSTQDGIWAGQINLSGGGFKTAVNTAYRLGQSNNFVAAINLKADLPFNIPFLGMLKPFFDAGIYSDLPTISEGYQTRFLYSGGLMLDSFEGVLNFYLPLFNSKEINDIYAEDKSFFKRISFSVNLKLYDINTLPDRDDLLFAQ